RQVGGVGAEDAGVGDAQPAPGVERGLVVVVGPTAGGGVGRRPGDRVDRRAWERTARSGVQKGEGLADRELGAQRGGVHAPARYVTSVRYRPQTGHWPAPSRRYSRAAR